MKAITYLLISLLAWPAAAFTPSDSKGDTVIIELNKNSKIVIYTTNKEDLALLQNYDINQMIRDLNKQLSDSVNYLEINGDDGNAYVNDDTEVNMNDWRIDDDEIRIKLGGMQVEVDPYNMDDEDWSDRTKTTYETARVERTTHHFNVDIGLNNWMEEGKFPDANNAPYSVRPFGSWYVGLTSLNRTWVAGPLFLEWGLGVNWYNWKLEDADHRIEKTDERIVFNEVVSPVDGKKSKLTASYINVQVVPMFDFSQGRRKVTSLEAGGVRIKRYSRKGIRLGVGVYAGYRLGGHTKFIYKDNGNREKDKERNNFYLENFRYGLRAQVGWKGLELFGTYDLNEVFSDGRGPDGSPGLNAISFGITL